MNPSILKIRGNVVSGKGKANKFVALRWVTDQLAKNLNMQPYLGTLNLKVKKDDFKSLHSNLKKAIKLVPPSEQGCAGLCLPSIIEGVIKAVIVVPTIGRYYDDQIELIASVNLRNALELKDGDKVNVTVGLNPTSTKPQIFGVILDMDGTLINTFDAFYLAIHEALSNKGYPIPTRRELREVLDKGLSVKDIFFNKFMIADEMDEFITNVSNIFNKIRLENVKPILRTSDALSLMRSCNVKIAIATGSSTPRHLVEQDLKRFKILSYIDVMKLSYDVSRRKPHPDLINSCISELNINAGACIAVGDSSVDVKAGRAAGCLTAAILSGVGSKTILMSEKPTFLEKDVYSLTEKLVLGNWL